MFRGWFAFHHASHVVELLAPLDGDRPVPARGLGRIVITDLLSRATALIRYDMGDLGWRSSEHHRHLAEVVGRRSDIIYGERGQAITQTPFLCKLLTFDDLQQFQFAQTDRFSHRLSVVAAEDPSRDAAIAVALRGQLGAGVSVEVEYVDEIDPLPSGKRWPVANSWQGTEAAGAGVSSWTN